MKRIPKLLLGAVSALAISALPINLDSVASGDFDAAAYAKGDKGGGNGNGNGGGNGGGNGKGGGAGERGKSADAKGHTKASGAGKTAGSTFGAVFGKERSRIKSSAARTSPAKTKTAKSSNKAVKMAALPAEAPLPDAKPKNFNAKLAGLNSLKRNYHAYLNSQSPRMAAIRDFVMASAEFDLAREDVAEATAALAEAQADFAAAVNAAGLTPYDGAVGVYDDPTVDSLEARLADLTAADETVDDPALDAEIAAVEGLLGSAEATAVADAETSLDEAELAAETAAVGTDDEALRAALLDAANDNRVAEYGDDYVDQEMMDWAKDLLGVGDAYGKIDEVRETLEPASE
jgi:hypothetical protein